MRVCLDARKLWDSGIGTYIRGILQGFCELQDEPQWDFIVRPQDAESELLTGKSSRCFPNKAGNYSLSELFRLSPTANAASAELYHAPHYVFPFNLKLPLVVTVHDIIHLKMKRYFSPYQRAYARYMLNRVGKCAKAVLTVSERTKHDLIEELGYNASQIIVSYLGVEEVFFQTLSAESLDDFQRKSGLPSEYILYVGNLKPHKNVSGLIEGWSHLPDSSRPPLVIVGDKCGAYKSLQQQVMAAGLEKEVFFSGGLPRDVMPALYKRASAYVQPSWYEGFGLPPLEAMAAGTPVVVSNRGSLPEIAQDAALIFNPADGEELTNVLEAVLTNSNLSRKLTEKGWKRVQEFSWKKTALKTLDAYRMAAQ